MRRAIAGIALAGLFAASASFGIAGAADRVAAATLIVPFFEVGVDVATDPEDTLLAIWNSYTGDAIVHYQVWDIDGVAVFNGNLDLAGLEGWNTSMRDLISLQSAGAKTALTVGSFYQGFVTFDVVSAATALTPQDAAYPFSDSNRLEGYIYYTRLSEGSANGISMVPIENVGLGVNSFLQGFYQTGDSREEIDVDARACAEQLASGVACSGDAAPYEVYRIHQRAFGSVPLTGASRLIVFAWTTGQVGGPSSLCDDVACDTAYPYKRYDDAGNLVIDGVINLDHVVTVYPITPETAGFVSIWDVPSFEYNTQIYAFTFNSAAPSGNPNLTWDAIFEAFIEP